MCELLAVDYRVNQDTTEPSIIALRKYVGMVLINLTYNDAKNKAVLCNMHKTLKAVIGQLRLTSEEDLVQVIIPLCLTKDLVLFLLYISCTKDSIFGFLGCYYCGSYLSLMILTKESSLIINITIAEEKDCQPPILSYRS